MAEARDVRDPAPRASSAPGEVAAGHRGALDERRLRWRARRGTRELDAMLGWWLQHRLACAGDDVVAAFDELLDAQDPDLWDWLMGHAHPPRGDWQAIIDDIRAAHRL